MTSFSLRQVVPSIRSEKQHRVCLIETDMGCNHMVLNSSKADSISRHKAKLIAILVIEEIFFIARRPIFYQLDLLLPLDDSITIVALFDDGKLTQE